MRPVNYFKKRFEYAIKSAGKDKKPTIYLNQNDIEALNQIIEFYDKQYKDTQLEDALLLFYILQNWKVENINNEELRMTQVEAENSGIFALSDSMDLFRKIGTMLKPKWNIIKLITIELRLNQKMNRVPDDKLITNEEVTEILNKELKIAKSQFNFLKQLNGSSIVKFQYKKGLTEDQKKMLGLTPQ